MPSMHSLRKTIKPAPVGTLRRLKFLNRGERERVLDRAREVCVDVAPPGSRPGYGVQEALEAAYEASIRAVLPM